jgi:transposase
MSNDASAVAELARENALLRLEAESLRAELADLKRRMFGPKSEKIDPAQMDLAIKAELEDAAIEEQQQQSEVKPVAAGKRRGGGRRPVPANLPVERIVIDVPAQEREGMEKIREDITEEIDYRPSQFIRRQIVRPVYAPKSKDQAPVQALAPKRVIPGSGVGTGLIAHVLVSRFCDHLPYYRLEQIAARQGVALERQKMCTWMEHAALLLKTVYDQLRQQVLQSRYVQADETPINVMDPDKEGATRKGWLWAYHAPLSQAVVFDFSMSRGQESVRAFFPKDWSGVVQSDGYAVYPAVFEANPRVEHAGCMAHARRMWVRAMDAGDVEAVPVLAQIQKLYQIESEVRDLSAGEREAARAHKSSPVLMNLNRLCQKALMEALPASATGKAASYLLERWAALELFAQPGKGHLNIDNNPVERGIRPTALGRKNWLFIGHPDAGWRTAVIYSVMGSCRLANLNPYEYIVWALEKLAVSTSANVGMLTPLAYKAVKEQH